MATVAVLFVTWFICMNSIVHGIVIFNNSNNMGYHINPNDVYNCITAPGMSANGLISIGITESVDDCISSFKSNGTYRSFIYFMYNSPLINNQNFSKHCYVRIDTWFTPVSQPNIISGQIDNFNECKNDAECEYNGQCINNKCKCKPAWKGNFCQYLNFKIGSKDLGYQRVNYSQWGGDTRYDNITNKWIMFATEMYDNCGINACCCTNSQIVKATSSNPGGPYAFDSVVVNYFAHEPMLGYSKMNGSTQWLLYHWGNGNPNDISNKSLRTDCIDGYTFGPPPVSVNVDDTADPVTYNYISYFSALNDDNSAWNMIKIPGDYIDSDLCPSNVYIFDNGSLLMTWVYRAGWSIGSVMRLITSKSWNTTYTIHNNNLFDINTFYDCSSLEDPFLWRDPNDGIFHLLMHRMIYVDNPGGVPWLKEGIGGHAYSKNGIDWILSPHYTYGSTICYNDGECVTYGRRERPHLVFSNVTGEPIFLTNGAQINNLVQYDKTILTAQPLYTSNDIELDINNTL